MSLGLTFVRYLCGFEEGFASVSTALFSFCFTFRGGLGNWKKKDTLKLKLSKHIFGKGWFGDVLGAHLVNTTGKNDLSRNSRVIRMVKII